jgi:integrase
VRSAATFHDTKNGKTRTVPLSRSVLKCLEQERKCRIVFISRVFPCAEIRIVWEYAVEKANLKELRFHDLRHTATLHLAMNGASTLEIAAILGYKTLSMIKR